MIANINPDEPEHEKRPRVKVEISDQHFHFGQFEVHDRAVTSGDITKAFDKHPSEDYVVLRRLDSLELEPIPAHEPVLIREHPPEQFFVIKGSELYRFVADTLSFIWPVEEVTGLTIKQLLNKNRDDIALVIRTQEGERVVRDHEPIHLSAPGLEHFFTRPFHPHEVIFHISVNGAAEEWHHRKMTYEQAVHLAFPSGPTGPDVRYSVSWTKPDGQEGSLRPGQSVDVVEEMMFDVRNTDKS